MKVYRNRLLDSRRDYREASSVCRKDWNIAHPVRKTVAINFTFMRIWKSGRITVRALILAIRSSCGT